MYATKAVMSDIPPDLLDLFAMRDGRVCWQPVNTVRSRNAKRAPWGSPAGGKAVIGRGALITVSGYTLLTADVAFALEHAGEWAWQIDATLVPSLPPEHDLDQWRAVIRSRFALDGGVLVWATDRGFTADRTARYAAGSPVTGLRLSGFRGSIVTTSSVGLLFSDVVSVLETGLFPWEAWN